MGKLKKIWTKLGGTKVSVPLPLLILTATALIASVAVLTVKLSRVAAAVDDVRRRADALEIQIEELGTPPTDDGGDGCYEEDEPQFLDIRDSESRVFESGAAICS